MSTIGGNNSIQEGLVFAYDTGNRLKSFKGEPTVNSCNYNPIDLITWSKQDIIVEPNVIMAPNGTLTGDKFINNLKADNVGRQSIRIYGSMIAGLKYTFSMFLKQSNVDTEEVSFWVDNGAGVVDEGVYYGAGNTVNLVTGTASNSTIHSIIPDKNGWYRCSMTFTATADRTSTQISIVAYTPGTTDVNNVQGNGVSGVYVWGAQFEQKPHPTPFTPNTRTVTDSLLDLTKNTTIDVTNTSFDSEGQMFFDGVGNKITIPHQEYLNPGLEPFTVEISTFVTSVGFQGGSYISKGLGTSQGWATRDSRFYVHSDLGEIARVRMVANQNVWEFHTFVIDQSKSPIISHFINGVLDNTGYSEQPGNKGDISNTKDLIIGYSFAGGIDRYVGGKLPITKIYNKALTAQEVKRNFQAIRSRFNI